jgi:hypothetical protein
VFTSNVKGKDFLDRKDFLGEGFSRLFPRLPSRGSGARFEKKRLHGIIGDTVGRNELPQTGENVEVGGDTEIGVDIAFEIEREVGRGVVDEAGGIHRAEGPERSPPAGGEIDDEYALGRRRRSASLVKEAGRIFSATSRRRRVS